MFKLIKHIIPFCLVLITLWVHAQTNLIPNPGFELSSTCPFQLSNAGLGQQVPLATNWVVPSAGTPDYFNNCAAPSTLISTPYNSYGYQPARGGNAYVGLLAYAPPGFPEENQREYIQTRLTQPLVAGKVYYFKMHVNLANAAFFRKSVSNIGAYFSENQIAKVDNGPFAHVPQVVSSSFITDTLNWTAITGSFTATGNERYVTIGRFGADNDATTKTLAGDPIPNNSYYYIDDVSLIDSCYQFHTLSNILGSDASYECVEKPVNIILNAQNGITIKYSWSTGQSAAAITVKDTGKYWVTMSGGRCSATDTIHINGRTKPTFTLGHDTAACFNSTLILKPVIQSPGLPYTYRWIKRVGSTSFELGNAPTFAINYPDEIILELSTGGCRNYDTIAIHPTQLQRVRLPADSTICRNTSISLNVQMSKALHYLWSTGESTGNIRSHNNNLIWVKASDSFCVSTDTMLFQIKGPVLTLYDTTFCGQHSLQLKGDPDATHHLWSTGDISSRITIDHGGMYTLSQQKDGCTVSDSVIITMDSIPYVDLGNDTSICVSPVYELKAIAPHAQSFLWDSGDTTSSIVFQKSGKYAVTTFNKGCSFRDSVLIQTQINTPFSFGGDKYDCFSEPIILNPKTKRSDKLLWSDGSKGTSFKVTQPGTYWLKVVSGFCTNYDTITFYPKVVPRVELGNDTTLCKGASLWLDAQDSADIYTWNTGADSRITQVTQTGLYYVEKRTAEGCYATDSIYVQFENGFELFKKHDLNICQDSLLVLFPTQHLSSYLWNDGSALPSLKVMQGGTYTLEAVDSNGCIVKDTVIVDELFAPHLVLDSIIRTCDFPYTLSPDGYFDAYRWSDGSSSPTLDINRYGSYSLTVTDTNGCRASASVAIQNNCPAGVKMTNVFTPNNDGLNDIIIPQYEHIQTTHFYVHNRWGNKVFETSDIERGWNGVLPNGQEAEAGVYFYILECESPAGETFSKQGTITLIR